GSGGSDAYGVIVIAADYNEMPSFNEEIRNVAFMSAGSAAQNMYVAGAVFKIQMLTQVSIPNKAIKKRLNLPKSVEPLTILSFGYSD
ncbi:MAG: nitroreductase family protein, partial [Deltaproteobacteria bacterium]|nr:nitroreductase family protein [Deltaproteobacteria bacterium]